jgi:UDP-N-acetylmuramoylalanine--D-glutamate ligase
MPAYHRAKHRIFLGCRSAVVNAGDPLTRPLVDSRVNLVSWRLGEPDLNGFGLRTVDGETFLCRGFDPLLSESELALAGRHNVANALAALAIAASAALDLEAAVQVLREFTGLPHRCQLVAELAGVRYVNDSKGTNVGATQAAIEGFGGQNNILLLAGGQGKGADFRSLRPAVGKHCKQLLLLGEAAPELEASLGDLVPARLIPTLEEGVQVAAAAAVAGDCVLLSPACASFDMFSGYAERGERFAAAVQSLPGAGR